MKLLKNTENEGAKCLYLWMLGGFVCNTNLYVYTYWPVGSSIGVSLYSSTSSLNVIHQWAQLLLTIPCNGPGRRRSKHHVWIPLHIYPPDPRQPFCKGPRRKKNTLLRVIPTMTFIHFLTGKSSGILSDISSGILSGILSGISSGICSGISSGILSGKSFWHSIWHIFWHSIWHIFWHSIWHIFWHSI